MKISWNYLQSWFAKPLDKQLVLERLTMTGLEVESDTPVAPEFSGVVVARVVECERHPDADKLTVCKVDCGSGELIQIICGAPNVKTGVVVPCAKVGAVLPGDFKIAERKMRGLFSYGMLCSGDELGCPDGVDGLLLLPEDAPIGCDIRDYLELDDSIIEFKITPNRGDCLSYLGLAREIAALTNAQMQTPSLASDYLTKPSQRLSLTIEAPHACSHYLALVMDNVDNSQATPAWLLRRLERSGIRSISPVVDIANWVMLSLGQPLHAFDYAKVNGGLCVRMAQANEQLLLLDNSTAQLAKNSLLISDQSGTPLALAGVMGGLDSGVTATTHKIILESAYFSRDAIQGQARHYGVSSDAAYRFERGVDFKLQHDALNLAAELLSQVCKAKAQDYVHYRGDSQQFTTPQIELTFAEIDAFIGQKIAPEQIVSILTGLGCQVLASAGGIAVTVPSYRFDLNIKADIIEEIVRVYGYDKIEAKMPKLSHNLNPLDAHLTKLNQLKAGLLAFGFNEIISYAFIEEKYSQLFADKGKSLIKLQNPIAGLQVMRNNLLPGLIKTLQANVNRGQERVRIFELARVFHGEAENEQPLHLAGLIYGTATPLGWAAAARQVDFYDLRQVVCELLHPYGEISLVANLPQAYCHPGRSANIVCDGVVIGYIAQLHPQYSQELSISEMPYVFELNLELLGVVRAPQLRAVSKFQKVSRDLALVVKQQVAAAELLGAIQQLKLPELIDLRVFDVFTGGNLGADEKSIALNLVFQAHKTLTDEEINHSLEQVKQTLISTCAARLR